MHEDVIKVNSDKIIKPTGSIKLVYFSSHSNNTHRFIEKLQVANERIPIDINDSLSVSQDYVLVTPTYSGGGDNKYGAVPKQVIKFLNNAQNRALCRGVVTSGNTNFGNTFALAGPIISQKLQVPLLYQFELLGTIKDVKTLNEILLNFWQKAENYE